MSSVRYGRYAGHRLFVALVSTLILLAWLALWLSERSPEHGWLLHALHGLDAFGGSATLAFAFIVGWTVMVVAMMLPTSLPLISMFRRLTSKRRDRAWLAALLVAGYLGVWTLFGGVVYLGGWTLHQGVRQIAWLEANTWVLGAGVLLLAGIYQFTPLKYHCLEKCRSPLSFIVEHWRGRKEKTQAFRLGARHGLFCVGCCWSLMLLMFLVGSTGAVAWMLVFGAIMAVEKNVSWGWRIGTPLGVVLIGLGLSLGTVSALQAPAEISLDPASGSRVSGDATFVDTDEGLRVALNVRNLPVPGATYLAHVHPGRCADDPAGHHDHHTDKPNGEIEHPLIAVVAGPEGNGSSTTVIEGTTVAELFFDTDLYVNVHAEAAGSEELSATLACGDLRRI